MTLPVLTHRPAAAVADRVRRLAELLTTPLLPAEYLDLISPLRAGADLRGRIIEVRRETRDAVTLVIRPGRGWLGHRPGQYVRIGVDVDGVRNWRAYSLTGLTSKTSKALIPEGCISVTVKAIPDGKVSNHLVRNVSAGTMIMLDQAAGDFTLPDPTPRKILFLTAGSGITPVVGMLRNAMAATGDSALTNAAGRQDIAAGRQDIAAGRQDIAAGRQDIAAGRQDIVVIHSAPTVDQVIFGPELRALAGCGRIRLVERHTDTSGQLSMDDVAALVPDWAQRQTWACGPTGLLDAAQEHWDATGVADQLHTERFRPTVLATGEGGTVTFSRSKVSVEAGGASPLLDVGEDAGLIMPSGCRMGICFGCVLPLREGAVRDLRNGEVTTAEPENPILIQTCVSAAAGTCDIDL